MELSNEIIKVLDDLGQRFGLVIDWTQQNIIPYVQQLVSKIMNYKIYTVSVGIGISFLFIIFTAIYIIKTNKTKKLFEFTSGTYDYGHFTNGNLRAVTAIIILAVSVCAMIPIFFVNLMTLIKCLTFPELIAFEFIKDL